MSSHYTGNMFDLVYVYSTIEGTNRFAFRNQYAPEQGMAVVARLISQPRSTTLQPNRIVV